MDIFDVPTNKFRVIKNNNKQIVDQSKRLDEKSKKG